MKIQALALSLVYILSSGNAIAGEALDRGIDRIALLAQEKAIRGTEALIQKSKDRALALEYRFKLAELQDGATDLRFRILHGSSQLPDSSEKAKKAYKQGLFEAWTNLDQILKTGCPESRLAEVRLKRGRIQEDLGEKKRARQEYETLLKESPKSREAFSAALSLAELLAEANEHARAVQVLEPQIQRTSEERYPFALYRLAWSHMNLGHYETALDYVKRHGQSNPGESFRENLLLDSAGFVLKANEEKVPGFQLNDAWERLHSLESGPHFGKVALRYAKLLRSHQMDDALESWSVRFLKEESRRAEAPEILSNWIENGVNHSRWSRLGSALKWVVPLQKIHSDSPAQKSLTEFLAKTAQNLPLDSHDQSPRISLLLTLLEVTPPESFRLAQLHRSLGDAYFRSQAFSESVTHYRWEVEHGRDADTKVTGTLLLLGARYSELKALGAVPEMPQPADPTQNEEWKISKANQALFQEWLSWIDSLDATFPDRPEIREVAWNGARLLYSLGQRASARTRLEKLYERNPSDLTGARALALTLDSWVASKDWSQTRKAALHVLSLTLNPDEKKKVETLAQDAWIQELETTGDPNEFLSRFPHSRWSGRARLIAAQKAVRSGDRSLALEHLRKIPPQSPDSAKDTLLQKTQSDAFLLRAQIAKDELRFSEAADSLLLWLKSSPEVEKSAAFQQALTLIWAAGQRKELQNWIENSKGCTGSALFLCDRVEALMALSETSNRLTFKVAWSRAKDEKRPERSLWAGWLVLHSESLSYPEINRALRILGKNWKALEPLEQLELLHHFRVALPKTVERSREELARFSPLRSSTKSLIHRIESIRDWENAAVQLLNLPSQALHQEIFRSTALLYRDFHEGIAKLPFPKGLSADDESAYRASIREISEPVLAKAQQLTEQGSVSHSDPEAVSVQSRFQSMDYWTTLEPLLSQQSQWLDAFRSRNIPLQALVGRGLSEQAGTSPRLIQVIHAASLATAGAEAEAFALIRELSVSQ